MEYQIEQLGMTSSMLNTGSPGRLSRIETKVRNDIYRVYSLMCFPVFEDRGSVITAARYITVLGADEVKGEGGFTS